MTATHIVEAGEHLGTIARKFGFENFSVLWEHPSNAAIKALRKDPTLLAPGDEIFIPDRVRLVFSRLTDASHDFKVHLDTLKLSLRLLELDGEPRKNARVVVRVETPETGGASSSNEQELVTDGDGNVTYGEAFTVQPFGNSLVTMTLSTQQIRDVLEQQFPNCFGQTTFARVLLPSNGLRYEGDHAQACGAKVRNATLLAGGVNEVLVADGALVNPTRSWRVAVNNFLADGGGFHFFDKIACDGQRHIGFEQRDAHFAQGVNDVGLAQRAAPRQPAEHAGKFAA